MNDGVEGRRRRGIYLLPNLFTTAGLFAGFYAIVSAMNGRFEAAAVSIFIAMIMDGLDGRVARMTNTQSDFGKEYDSLCDMICFGLAPALVMYSYSLQFLGKLGWLASFMFTAAVGLRLARFNTQVDVVDRKYFQGLASPAGAAVMAAFVWMTSDFAIDGADIAVVALLITVLIAGLMVSNIRYHSFKEIDLKGRVPFVALLMVVLAFVLVSVDPPRVLFLLFVGYVFSGPFMTLLTLRKKRRFRRPGGIEAEETGASPPSGADEETRMTDPGKKNETTKNPHIGA